MKEEYQELVNRLNPKLANEFGYFTENVPRYRIAYSDDQFEWRQGTVNKFDTHGNKIGEQSGMQFLPKYRQWMPHMWVLERCCDTVNELKNGELITPYSYEPLFPFMNKERKPIPPDWDVCWLVIASVHARMGQPIKIYKDPDLEPGAYELRIAQLQAELFGNESDIGDALSHKEAVGYSKGDS